MINSETKICQNCRGSFTIDASDFQFYEKIKVPPPTWCPECRLIRRLVWRNERTLYKTKCNAPGHSEDLISYLDPSRHKNIFDQKYWWSDAWDGCNYGVDYDFSKPFFIQFKELLERVPKPNLSTNYSTLVNSDYSNWAGNLKNCYLVTDADFVENSAYCSSVMGSKDCYECNTITSCELCYEGVNLRKCYRAIGCVNCHECADTWFSKGCVGCNNCFGCISLRKKSYHIFNEPYSKEEYHKKVSELFDGSRASFESAMRKAEEFWLKFPHKYRRGLHNTNSTGDYIYHTKNTKYGFLVSDVEDSKYVALLHSPSTKDCFDYTDWGEGAERLYECSGVGIGAYNIKFSNLVVDNTKDAYYSWFCSNSSDIFGCAVLKKKRFCILNKQYTEKEYRELLPRILKQMDEVPYIDTKGRIYKYGEFFPPEISLFAYNETFAQEAFTLTKEEATEKGFAWKDRESRNYQITKRPEDMPEYSKDTDESILNEIIGCAHDQRSSASDRRESASCNHQCSTAFKIIPDELSFYRRMNLPLPRLCPNCRHYERLRHRNPMRLWHRKCQCGGQIANSQSQIAYRNTVEHFHGTGECPNEFETSYAPDRPEIVYCENCYNAEVA